ncbi:ComEC/Rec2 family competence protein [Flavobacterium sp. W22_SRS_FK3]|uniref:ComEC/Rec2 family competence protein n=1 Tax=Flavobacterium sp. W22_SRS_FK3 TaxID=3240275 RepID=UPI003F8EA947
MKVLNFPLTRITICFIIGVLTAYYWKPGLFFINAAVTTLLITFSGFYFLSKKRTEFIFLFSINTYLTSFFIGCLTLLFHTESLQKTNYINCKKAFEKPHNITLCLREKLKGNDYNQRYIGVIKKIEDQNYSGKIIINIQKDSLSNSLIIGNIIRLKTILQRNPSPKNPNQFDYSKYLKDKQIYAQVYITKSEISINKTINKNIWYYSAKLHSRIVNNLNRNHFNPNEMNVALALILGQRQEISSEIVHDYQFSGAMHVLSVSGLHVGFIMFFIAFILKPIANTPKGSIVKLITVLTSLAVFAIISGLSPSVLRSVVMFSFLAIGNQLRRNGNTYHTLLVSILLILLFEPYFLFDIGFQLSYLALFFILWLQPILKCIWTPKNKILINIRNVLTVSFAAQIGTFPLCLYYFHQFPGLFFATNIIIIPILSLIMFVGIIVMILAAFNIVPLFLHQILEKSIYFLNKVIHFVASFDSFVIRDISFNFYYLFTFYLMIISAIIWWKKPSYNKFIILLISIITVQISLIYTKKESESQHEMVIYNIKKNTLISERIGHTISFYTNDTLSVKSSNVLNSYTVGSFGNLKSVSKIKNTLFFNDKRIFVIDSSGVYGNKIQPDILLITQSPKINLERVLQNLHPKIIITDASNSNSIQKKWRTTCLRKGIPFHSTAKNGFYKLL